MFALNDAEKHLGFWGDFFFQNPETEQRLRYDLLFSQKKNKTTVFAYCSFFYVILRIWNSLTAFLWYIGCGLFQLLFPVHYMYISTLNTGIKHDSSFLCFTVACVKRCIMSQCRWNKPVNHKCFIFVWYNIDGGRTNYVKFALTLEPKTGT